MEGARFDLEDDKLDFKSVDLFRRLLSLTRKLYIVHTYIHTYNFHVKRFHVIYICSAFQKYVPTLNLRILRFALVFMSRNGPHSIPRCRV